jgi:hypothetical protein
MHRCNLQKVGAMRIGSKIREQRKHGNNETERNSRTIVFFNPMRQMLPRRRHQVDDTLAFACIKYNDSCIAMLVTYRATAVTSCHGVTPCDLPCGCEEPPAVGPLLRYRAYTGTGIQYTKSGLSLKSSPATVQKISFNFQLRCRPPVAVRCVCRSSPALLSSSSSSAARPPPLLPASTKYNRIASHVIGGAGW